MMHLLFFLLAVSRGQDVSGADTCSKGACNDGFVEMPDGMALLQVEQSQNEDREQGSALSLSRKHKHAKSKRSLFNKRAPVSAKNKLCTNTNKCSWDCVFDCDDCLSEGCLCDTGSNSCAKDLSCETRKMKHFWDNTALASSQRYCLSSDTLAKIEEGIIIGITVVAAAATGGAALGVFAVADVAGAGGVGAVVEAGAVMEGAPEVVEVGGEVLESEAGEDALATDASDASDDERLSGHDTDDSDDEDNDPREKKFKCKVKCSVQYGAKDAIGTTDLGGKPVPGHGTPMQIYRPNGGKSMYQKCLDACG
mmetsp:Transcript_11451/g.18268  ORF Transcript_11451/g.18268 Transcript_11451/m.18268 type:complete len:309 (+) Transcript_11451:82-1008(+)|eukprot:CAMPEP_0115067492 /NCGR_PEP_ID=MMETSP0227-20121206/11420_1 /TAXON_ID=89957 /ORGANISM="Polarella glacialis, Strain CCMP 1383" /LENGTH=308 /DNA_ID=CAMNT_0002453565 /DNA_START=73 /DNA_END=999 /DNA_ORIENTATION=+